MKNLKIIVSFLFLLVLSNSIHAQKNFTKDADTAFRNEAFMKAKDLYKKACPKVSKASDKARIIFQIGECYRILNDDPNAEISYLEAMKLGYADQNKDVIARLADVQKEQGKYDDAIKNYDSYMDAGGDSTVTRTGVKSCRLAIKQSLKQRD